MSAGVSPLLPWYDLADWTTDPPLAYVKGLQDGYQLGRDDLNDELVRALAAALGGPDCTSYEEGVRRHLRAIDQNDRRRRADAAPLNGEQAA